MLHRTEDREVPRLLIVDDDPLQTGIIRKVAFPLGFEVSVAHSADAAIDLLSAQDFSHVTVDLALGERDGVELLRWIASRKHLPHVIVISGCEERILTATLRMLHAAGMGDAVAIAKPIDFPALCDALYHPAPSAKTPRLRAATASGVTALTLQQALRDDAIYPVFQPKLHLSTGRVVGCEALARWKSPEGDAIAPNLFVPAAERLGLIKPLTLLMLDRSLSAMRGAIARDPQFSVSVNLSAILLSDLSMPAEIENILLRHEIPSQSLVIEVTESKAISDMARATDVLLRLRLKGIGLSIDDFGTGYSSLSVLARMPFNELKIDQSFVRAALTDQDMWKIIRGSTVLAHEFGMNVVAEGIEDMQTWQALDAIGCDTGQGFLFAPGLPGDEFEAWLGKWRPQPVQAGRRFVLV